jgi:hypothetical protein
MPTKTLAELDTYIAQDPACVEARRALARPEAITRKLIRLRLMLWRRRA